MEELADGTDEGFNSGFHEMEELTDETDEDFNSGFHEMEELTDETDEDFNSGFHEMEELTDETDEDFNSGFHEMEELTDETDEDFNSGFHEMEELADETDEGFDSGFHEMDELADRSDEESEENINSQKFEPNKESQDEEKIEKEEEYENIGSQSTVLMHENPEIEGENQEELQAESEEYTEEEEEYLENEEEAIEIDPEEYENDQDPIIDTEEIEFVRDMEELGRMLKEYDEKLGYPEEENDNTAFNAEQAYREIKERNSNKEEKEEAQELEEQEKEITEKQKEEHIEENLSDDAQEEDVNDISEEAEIEPEEFDYLWEKYEQYEQEGKSTGEITNLMHEAEETYKMLKEAEKVYEQQEKDKLKLVDHEEKLHQQGKSQEEIDDQVEEIAKDFFLSEVEEIQQNERERDVSEELKIEEAEIDDSNSDLKESEQIKQISVYNNDENSNIYQEVEKKESEEEIKTELNDIKTDDVEPYHERINESIEKEDKLESKEKEEEYEKLQQLFRQETGKRPMYAGKETKGFIQWLVQQELKTEELKEKEQQEEKWQKKLKKWIERSTEEELSSELKVILKEIIQNFREYEELEELYKKYENGKLTEKEREKLISIIRKLQHINPIYLHLYLNIRGFKAYFQESHWWNPWLIKEIKYKFLRHLSNKYELIREEFSKSDENLPHKPLSEAGMLAIQALQLAILTIYYICEIFQKNSEIDKKFFSGSELNYILDKHSQYFYSIKKKLEESDLIQYYGTVTRKKKSNEKIYIITEKGIKFTEEIIEIKRRDFPILFDKLIATLEKRYIEYNKDLINSENKIIIRSQKDINDELRKIAGDNNIELVNSYRSDHLDIKFRCKKCKKQFKDTYQLIKSRKAPKLFCPYCFPELKTNIYLSEELKVQISKFAFTELRKTTLHKLSKNKILDIIEYIKKLVFNFIEPQIIEKKSEFKEFIEKYICSIVGFLTEVKRLYETNQFINLSEISLLFHDKSIVSESMWQAVCRAIIKYLREEFDFNIRTKRYDSLPESTRQSIRNYRTLYRLILGVDRSGNIITYLDIDFKTEIKIYYDGKCQGIIGYCPFDIDYKFLPALSFDHRLENYNAIVKRKGIRYISPKTMLGGSFNEALAKMKSQIGGMDLRCRNCHSSRHHKMYYFLPIFNFLKSLHIKDIDVNTTYVLDSVNLLVKKYFDHTKKDIKLSKKYTQAQILSRIRNQIFRLIKKKYIVEYLFGTNYICPLCQKANINDHLTCFEAHHTNKTLFENGFQKIIFSSYNFKSIKWLIKNLITQECIYVCRNCHTMITAINYNENALIILENEIDALYVNTFYDNLYKKINEKRDIIIHWKSQLKIA